MTQFADSVSPSSIPAQFAFVAAYGNGKFEWPDSEIRRFRGHILIGVLSGQPAQARKMRVLDVEKFDANPSDAPPFIAERKKAGHSDATIYCDLAAVADVLAELKDAGMMHTPGWRLWLAWYHSEAPTQKQVLDELASEFGVTTLEPERLWACQWNNGTSYDTSVMYGAADFAKADELAA